jgi:hypothetical protein
VTVKLSGERGEEHKRKKSRGGDGQGDWERGWRGGRQGRRSKGLGGRGRGEERGRAFGERPLEMNMSRVDVSSKVLVGRL